MANKSEVDIEEARNLFDKQPKLARELDQKLTTISKEMDASFPYYNPKHE